jgi:tRNA1Val (adenine37-N6)-methyltransferase
LISNDPKFKGWAKPGPFLESPVELEEGESLDALSGTYRIYQYTEGHRFSTDDLLVAWFATSHAIRADRVLDLGSGIGSVAMTAAWRLPGAKFTTVEAQERSIRLARKSVRYNQLESRFDLRLGDFRDETILASDEKFDLIMGSPPYFPLTDGVLSDHPQKVECRFEARGDVRDYCARAGKHLAPGGMFFVVFPKNQETRLLEGVAKAGLEILRSRSVVFREGEPPLLALYQMAARDDFPPKLFDKLKRRDGVNLGWEEPPLTIRRKDGEVHPEYVVAKLAIGFPP